MEEKRGNLILPEIPVFSPEFEAALQDCFPSDDPLDAPNFDPIAYINAQFPDEASVTGDKLTDYIRNLNRRAATLQDSITKESRLMSSSTNAAKRGVVSATAAVQDLFTKVNAIKDKATQSEVMVQEICSEIRGLDYAKRNLTDSMRALHNVHMITSSLDSLEQAVTERNYRDCSGFVMAVEDLMTKFNGVDSLSKVAALRSRFETIKTTLRAQLMEDFKNVIPKPMAGVDTKVYQYACATLDALSPAGRTELVAWFCRVTLEPYGALFAPGKENALLEQTDRRYAWLRRALNSYKDEHEPIFPSGWNVNACLAHEFCLQTRAHLGVLLKEEAKKPGGLKTEILTRALEKTLEIERELQSRFAAIVNTQLCFFPEDKEGEKALTAADKVRDKYAVKTEEKKQPAKLHNFTRLLSPVFMTHLGGYILTERQNFSKLLQRTEREEKWTVEVSEVEPAGRLASSDTIFSVIKASIGKVVRLTKGRPFLEVFFEYRQCMEGYAQLLWTRIPANEQAMTPAQQAAVCQIVNTAEYCGTTLPALCENVQGQIDSNYREQVVMDELLERFKQVSNKGAQCLVGSVLVKLSRPLAAMTRVGWWTFEQVGDQSEYVNHISAILREDTPLAARLLSTSYHNFFCTQLVGSFIQAYMNAIYACKRIGQIGAQQLGIDANALTSLMLQIPVFGKGEKKVEESKIKRGGNVLMRAFTRYVEGEMGKVDSLLKVVRAPNEQLILIFRAVCKPARLEDLTKILGLKGLQKAEIRAIVDAYNANAAPSDRFDAAVLLSTTEEKSTFGVGFFKAF